MFEIFFKKYPEYTIAQKPDKELLGRFEGKLPDQPIDFREAYGFGTYVDGYLKLVNPLDFQSCFDEPYHDSLNGTSFF
ncbi:GAD-like domain-containing protein [Pedobacter sp. ok626]|uniref:GAD-like domain-containing protein n=1 Tax=Pedobacter sp. ok626 TaxID=1761882 RepID=UPI001404D413|nr:GAD-like domain-containing protein [Pedobacter sp. ok626]